MSIINLSLGTGICMTKLKLPKEENPHNPKSFHPVSFLTAVSKFTEQAVQG